MKVFLFRLLVLLVVLAAGSVNAQKDSLKVKDSINSSLLKDYNLKLTEIDRQRIVDSIKKDKLEDQLNLLKTTDNLKKEELQAELQELYEKEEKRLAEKKSKIDSLRANAKAFPVIGFFDDTLFLVYSKLGSFTASDRAVAIAERIKILAEDYSFSKKTLQVIEAETTFDIIKGENIIMSISENDAIWNNTTKQEMANKYKNIITNEVIKFKDETSLVTLAKEFGLALLVLIILGVLIYYTIRLFRWTAQKISEQQGKKIKGVKIKNYTLLDDKRLVSVIL